MDISIRESPQGHIFSYTHFTKSLRVQRFSWNETSKSLESTTHGQGGHQDDVDVRGKHGPSINPNRTLARLQAGQKGRSRGTPRNQSQVTLDLRPQMCSRHSPGIGVAKVITG